MIASEENGGVVTQSKRITVSARIYAKHVYPGLDSVKSAKAYRVNIVLSDDEALNLARHLCKPHEKQRSSQSWSTANHPSETVIIL